MTVIPLSGERRCGAADVHESKADRITIGRTAAARLTAEDALCLMGLGSIAILALWLLA